MIKFRLLAQPKHTPEELEFTLAFAAPAGGEEPAAAPAELDYGDGETLPLGEIAEPSTCTWRREYHLRLGSHQYAGQPLPVARVRWGDLLAETDPAAASEQPQAPAPDVKSFDVEMRDGRPLERVVRVQVLGLTGAQQLRIDGGADQSYLVPARSGEAEAEFQFQYPKPGDYQVGMDLLDADGFWLAALAESQVAVTAPDEEQPASRVAYVESALTPYIPVADSPGVRTLEQPWLPFRFARPQWGWQRTYKVAGGNVVSRVLALGTYLSVRAETQVQGALWYQTGSRDWLPADGVEIVRPSGLRGVNLRGGPPPSARSLDEEATGIAPARAVVTASALNVREQPGRSAANLPLDQLHAGAVIDVHERVQEGGGEWVRIGEGRWVHADHLQPLAAGDAGQHAWTAVVTASSLNVRSQPGVWAGNPPLDQLRAGTQVTIYEECLNGGAAWCRIGADRWVLAQHLQPLRGGTRGLDEAAGQLSLPFGWVVASSLHIRAHPGTAQNNQPIGTVNHYQVLSVLETQAVKGVNWYRVGQGRWVEGSWVGVARLRQRPSGIAADEQWVAANLKEQTLVAYEGDTPVYAALVSTGAAGTPTVRGVFRTNNRVASGKMSGGNPGQGSYYYLEDVTWTCYFHGGYSLHTAYWHDSFGRPRSHGCVNLSPYDAWWIYQWSAAGGKRSPAVYVY